MYKKSNISHNTAFVLILSFQRKFAFVFFQKKWLYKKREPLGEQSGALSTGQWSVREHGESSNLPFARRSSGTGDGRHSHSVAGAPPQARRSPECIARGCSCYSREEALVMATPAGPPAHPGNNEKRKKKKKNPVMRPPTIGSRQIKRQKNPRVLLKCGNPVELSRNVAVLLI